MAFLAIKKIETGMPKNCQGTEAELVGTCVGGHDLY
jgi:hypothetical protein